MVIARHDLLRQASVELVRTLLPTAKGIRLLGVTVSNFDPAPVDADDALPLFGAVGRRSRRADAAPGVAAAGASLMARRAGSADLPLHGGRVPKWLGDRMTRLGAVITEAIVLEYGRDELLRRLAHPFWFQSFGAVMGMDWHSSGITTSVIGALKRGLAPLVRRTRHPCLRRPRQSLAPDAA